MFEGVDFEAIFNIVVRWITENFDINLGGGDFLDKIKVFIDLLFAQPPVV